MEPYRAIYPLAPDAEGRTFIIAGLGEVLWDVYPDRRCLGGAPANFAAHVCQAGHRAKLFSGIGRDDDGIAIINELNQIGIDTRGVQRISSLPTGTVKIRLNDKGQPQFECTRNVAFDDLVFDDGWLTAGASLDAVLFGTLAQRSEPSRLAIQSFLDHADKAVKLFDLNLRGWDERTEKIILRGLEHCQLLKLNEEELSACRKIHHGPADRVEFLLSLLKTFKIEWIALTCGEGGCMLLTEAEVVHHPGFRVSVVDTTGCGDAFAAVLIIGYLQGRPLKQVAAEANRLGAYVAMHQGAVPVWRPENLREIWGLQHPGRE
jgi:fructokinase